MLVVSLDVRFQRLPEADISWSEDSGAHGASFRSPAYTPPYRQRRSRPMTSRRAACSCGQLHLSIEGEPSRISMCHCLECQRRTGAVISNQARFRREQVTFAGKAATWTRTAESGNALTFHFCPICGSTVYWEGEGFPGYVAVAIGNFADPNFPAPMTGCGRSHATPGSPCRLIPRPSAWPSRGHTSHLQCPLWVKSGRRAP